MNKLLIPFCVALTVAACASTPSTPGTASTPTARASTPSNSSILNNCAPINPSAAQTGCVNQNASSYSQQTWQTRGATNTAEALSQTSPAVSVR